MLVNGIMFWNENMLFRVRYEELKDVVDFFLVVEGNETFSGRKKTINFQYSHFPKVIHRVISLPSGTPWEREYYQRNSIQTFARELGARYLLYGDADEITSAKGIQIWIKGGRPHNAAFMGKTYYYYFDLYMQDHDIPCGVVLDLEQTHQDLQTIRRSPHAVYYPNSGWHFSFIGDVQWIKEKILSYSHTELAHFANDEHLIKAIKNKADLFNRNVTFLREDRKNLPNYLPEEYLLCTFYPS